MISTTTFGFNMGSMEVTRTCEEVSASIISIKTPKTRFSVRATKTGMVRFYDDKGSECELVIKKSINKS
jgi:hypothetical protein